MIKVLESRFVKSCAKLAQAPQITSAEIAILGRSNVGKSSLINALLNHKNLAKSSSTPGKTRLVNFFESKWRVDLDCEKSNDSTHPLAPSAREGEFFSSLRDSRSESKQSKSRDFKKQSESRAEKRINKSSQTTDSLLQHCDSQNLDSRPLDCHENPADFLAMTVNYAKSRHRKSESPKQSKDSPSRSTSGVRGWVDSLDLPQTEFAIHILDFPGFGYAKVSKSERSSWDRNLSAFLKKRESIKLFIHLIDSRHTNLKTDSDIRAFLQSILRQDADILEVFTKADKLKKSEIHALKGKILVSTMDKKSIESLRYAILAKMYHI